MDNKTLVVTNFITVKRKRVKNGKNIMHFDLIACPYHFNVDFWMAKQSSNSRRMQNFLTL
jgi:hypothetical protein